jgi:hypothetical protein
MKKRIVLKKEAFEEGYRFFCKKCKVSYKEIPETCKYCGNTEFEPLEEKKEE